MDYKATPLEIVELKAGQDGWSFSAYSSAFNLRDHGGDVIVPGAFDRTLKSSRFRPLLWQHDMREPIGVEKSLKPDGKGLLGSWDLVDTQRGEDAYKLLKRGAIRSMSIGYMSEAFKYDDAGDTRILEDIELLENSLVSIPMQDGARVQSVKSKYCPECGRPADAPVHQKAAALALDTQVPFEDLCTQIKGHLMFGVGEAEALHARRVEDQRSLTPAHIDALAVLLEELKGSSGRIETILTAVSPPEVKANGALGLHNALALAKRRARERDRARLDLGDTTP